MKKGQKIENLLARVARLNQEAKSLELETLLILQESQRVLDVVHGRKAALGPQLPRFRRPGRSEFKLGGDRAA